MVAARQRHSDPHVAGARGNRAGRRTTDDLTAVSARSEWAPDFAIYDLESTDELLAADPDDYPDDIEHYLWTWTDRDSGVLRSRMFAADLGVPEDEATGAAAVRITDYLSRDLTIVQGKGSVIADPVER